MTEISHSAARLWKSMQAFHPADQVIDIEFSEESAFPHQKITFPPFTVICGLHGSGKSSLLGYIAESLWRGSRHSDDPPFFGVETIGGESRPSLKGLCEVTLRRGDRIVNFTADLNRYSEERRVPQEILESGDPIFPNLLTPHILSSEINMFFQDFRIGDLERSSAGEPEVQNRTDREALRDILGVTYDEVTYIPVETDPKYSPIWPYVRARQGSRWIDSYSMSYGELRVHFLRWAIKTLGGIALLDEPEANIAPRGQAALLDELARLARSSKAQIILTTHSAEFLNRVPLDWVRMCVRPASGPVVVAPSRASDLRDTLGIENPLRSILVVEDGVAEKTLKLALSAHKFAPISECDVITAGSWQDVITTARALATSRRLKSVAILDGDQRNKCSQDLAVLSLPGDEPPEKVFFKYAATQPGQLAERLDCSIASINVYLAEMLGLEHHRWLKMLSHRTGQDQNFCLRVVFEIWHSDPVNQNECEMLTRQIEELIQ
ncbi:ATP-dependent endonuclease [Streptomyces sp. NPDC002962]|uniref:ATP-dependent nuclease n=1 Tax=Streptomyces sp. NPDC002962 TaxID=3364674 RepID=UPI0036BA71A6